MTISLHTLAVTGVGKKPAFLELHGMSHLVFGPTDTGKSYIVECLRYCLGSDKRPKDVGFSQGYTQIVLQIEIHNGEKLTIFRNLTDDGEAIYPGFHINLPQTDIKPLDSKISELVPIWSSGTGKKIFIKRGTLGNFTAGDLRRISIFDEIETLDNDPFEGTDTNLKARNKSSLALVLTGTDDSRMVLPPSTDQRNIAKGHIQAIEEQISSLLSDVPEGMTKHDAEEGLAKLSKHIDSINQYLQSNVTELTKLKVERAKVERENQKFTQSMSALIEAQSRFMLLDKKYLSDLERLQAMGTAAAVMTSFEARPCPLCLTDIQHQSRHNDQNEHFPILRQAAQAESYKILELRKGLKAALEDVAEDILEQSTLLERGIAQIQENLRHQDVLLSPQSPNFHSGLPALSERKAELAVAFNNLDRIERLRIRISEMQIKAKRTKQVIQRDVSQSASIICERIMELLNCWGVPGVNAVNFEESESDIEINQRKRISYGKGKRGIFLTAYMIALMERAIHNEYPHLGFTVIDSPVVTYKDPKHAVIEDADDLLDEGVKDRFYLWLADRTESGQVIILENEEPNELQKSKLKVTEFVGSEIDNGRPGFFPL